MIAALNAQKNSNTLNLGSIGIEEEDLYQLIEYLKINPYVNTLNLEHNSIDKPMMRILGEIIEKSNSIKYLNLSWNNI